MRYFFFLLCSLLLWSPELVAQGDESTDPLQSWELTQADWQELASYEGRFRIITPGPFREKVDSLETDLGVQVHHTYYFQPSSEKAENEVYMLSYVDFPAGLFPTDSTELIELFFAETEAAAVDAVLGELMFSQTGIQQGHPYRYWRIDYLNGRGSIRTKAMLVGDRFYTVQTVTQRGHGLNTSTNRYIDSFYIFQPNERSDENGR